MLFNSVQFLLFFAVVYYLYTRLRDFQKQNLMLLAASYVFYSAWDYRFLPIMVICTAVNFFAAGSIAATTNGTTRKVWLAVGLTVSFLMLAVFKYYNFGVQSFQALLSFFGLRANLGALNILLPVGISFYTFHTVSYTVDVYRGDTRPTKSFVNFALYVAYFPQLVAGPIQQSAFLLPELEKPRSITREDVRLGCWWVVLGYAKKVIMADTLAPLVDAVFDNPADFTGATCAAAVVAFAVQIYGDFAGYTLIARGVSQLMGIPLIENFRRPYLAVDPRDFWRRWHISLSLWLKNYLYLPLGGSRNGLLLTCRNLMITMLLGGLWHGANWTFVLWGGYHGVLLCICHVLGLGTKSDRPSPVARTLRIPATFCLTLFGWLLFRAQSAAQLKFLTANIVFNFHWDAQTTALALPALSMLGLLMGYHAWQEVHGSPLVLLNTNAWFQCGVVVFLIVLMIAVGFKPVPFIYFQF